MLYRWGVAHARILKRCYHLGCRVIMRPGDHIQTLQKPESTPSDPVPVLRAGALADAASGPPIVDSGYISHWIHLRYQACGFMRYLSDSDMKARAGLGVQGLCTVL